MAALKFLFVCSGNICRSPTAEAVMRQMAAADNAEVEADSAGVHDFHAGESADSRAAAAAAKRGYDMANIVSRPVRADDFHSFDFLLAMDRGHFEFLKRARPDNARGEVAMFLPSGDDVPDPYYGGARGFDDVLAMVEAGCRAWLKKAAAQCAGRQKQ